MIRGYKELLILFTIYFLFIGCKPLANLNPNDLYIEQLNEKNCHLINGFYSNNQDTAFGKIVHTPGKERLKDYRNKLLERFFIVLPGEVYEKGVVVQIKCLSKTKINVTALQQGNEVFTRNIRGKYKNGYFYLRPKIIFIPFFPIYYVHNFERARISKTANSIMIDHTIRMWGFSIFAGSGDSGNSTSMYLELKK